MEFQVDLYSNLMKYIIISHSNIQQINNKVIKSGVQRYIVHKKKKYTKSSEH